MKKVAILGGGPAGLAAAWHLQRSEEPLEITVYQQGWRLGGKGSAGRGPAGRIEEHGIHLFGNFYANALGMMRSVYAETNRSFDQELLPNNLHLSLLGGRRYSSRVAQATVESRARGDDDIHPELLGRKLVRAFVESAIGMTEIPDRRPGLLARVNAGVRRWIARLLTSDPATKRTAQRLGALISAEGVGLAGSDDYARAVRTLLRFRLVVRATHILALFSTAGKIRHAQADLLFTAMHGAIADEVFTRGIDSIDDLEYLDWLECHGAHARTLGSVTVRGVPNICFQYPAGDTERGPSMSAAAFLTFILRQLAAPGPNFWYFRRGTGEGVILPVYDALTEPSNGRNPVKFEFFTRIKDVVPDNEGRRSVASIVIRRHARPLDGPYDPILEAAGLRHWPSGPLLDRLDPEGADAIRGIDLEDWYALFTDEPGEDEVLVAGQDFDAVVLAIPPPAHRWTCPSLLADPAWAEMVDGLEFIPTQSVQLWMNTGGPEIGLPAAPYRRGTERWSTAEWIDPISCWVDFSDLIAEEHWARRPGSLFYFCGPLSLRDGALPDPCDPANGGYPDEGRAAVPSNTVAMLGNMGRLLPGAVDELGMRYDLLASPDGSSEPTGPARLSTQYLRANILPTERYGLSRPCHLRYRRKAWESGYSNLVLAGDWTFTGININSFEGAVASGALASYALSGTPAKEEITGYGFLRPDGGPDRPGPPILETIDAPD